MEILKHIILNKNKGKIIVKYENIIYKLLYKIDNKENYSFKYKNNKKPLDIDFEYNLICNL